MSTDPRFKLLSNGTNFVSKIHNDTYPAIDSAKVNLSGKIVLITGASKGVGRATALSYAKAGALGIILGARSSLSTLEKEISEAARSARKEVPKVLSLRLDVCDKGSVEAAATQVEREFGHLDILINNAGYLEKFVPIGESDPDEYWKSWETNFKGTYLMTRYFIPLLLKSKLKTVVNLTSIGANLISWGGSGYQTAKMAMLRFTEFLMNEYGEKGILAYCVHPGGVITELAMGMPETMHHMLTDKAELASDTMVWLTKERREWLAGRYIAAPWDVEELDDKKEDIVKNDLLKVRMAV